MSPIVYRFPAFFPVISDGADYRCGLKRVHLVFYQIVKDDYGRFVRANEVKQSARNYLTAYFIGLDNIPAFGCRTGRLNNLFYQSYQRPLIKYPGTRFANLIKGYLNLLAENGFQKARPVLEYLTGPTTL